MDPLSILSKHTPFGVTEVSVVLNETVFPPKHTDRSVAAPPNDVQKSFSDCQASVSFDGELGSPAPPFSGGWKGELSIVASLQVSQTTLQ
jgi:hypothetical protein